MPEATGELIVTGGGEETYAVLDSGKLRRAGGTQDFSGGIEGRGRVEWLMCYREDGTADYVGMQEIEGTIGERKGGFVLTAVGTFDGQQSGARWTVVQGSGTGELTGIAGSGEFNAGPGPRATFRLAYELG